ncbi:MAG: GDP-mannose 4,6-dehydratase [Candidatus Kerfeldbacteria bacterium]|nr:GDP-mannose 4,6-dehydratase [Candidatus Kerfeldbacteria bacterium]
MPRQTIFDQKNILVIGGAGFIGSHVCDELIKHNKVICIDNFITSQVSNIEHLLGNPNFIFLKHDVSTPFDLNQFPELEKFQVQFQGVQEVYNLATPTNRHEFEQHVYQTLLANSLAVRNSLEIARVYQAKYLLASSSAVYGDPLPGQDTLVEQYWGYVDPIGPRSCYNEGKRFAESFVMGFGQQFNVNVRIARIFNTYGPRMALNSGRMIPDFVAAAAEGRELIIYGDGTETDTYCYVRDVVDGLLRLMNYSVTGPVNLGSPERYPMMSVAQKIIQFTESKSTIKFDHALPFLMKPGVADIHKAKERLGWFPVVALDDGLRQTVADMLGSRVLTYVSV